MIWQRHGEVGMVSEPFRVGKYFLDGCTLYGLWNDKILVGYFNSFEQCQEAAEKHASSTREGIAGSVGSGTNAKVTGSPALSASPRGLTGSGS